MVQVFPFVRELFTPRDVPDVTELFVPSESEVPSDWERP
jgi:hypothetical protein